MNRLILAAIAILPLLASCDQFKAMGKKGADEKESSSDPNAPPKAKPLEEAMQPMEKGWLPPGITPGKAETPVTPVTPEP